MALHIINGVPLPVIDGGVVPDGSQVFGGSYGPVYVDGGWVDGTTSPYGGDFDGLYTIINGGWVDSDDVIYGGSIHIRPLRSYRRIQLDGGGRILFEMCIDDEAAELFFEFWKNGRPFPLVGVSPPVFTWKPPTGATGEAVARIIEGEFGRVGVNLFQPHEVGTWKLQVRYVDFRHDDIVDRGRRPPYSPARSPREFWRRLPKALTVLVRHEGGW